MKYLIFISTMLFLFLSCEKPLFKDDKLSLPKESFNGNQLKTSGYYYDPYQVDNGTVYHRNYFFYKNGVVLYGGTVKLSSLAQREEDYMDGSFFSETKGTKYYWGVFVVNGNNLKFEKWYPNSGGPLRAYIEEGEILNDTTFHISESYRMQNGSKKDIKERDRTYHFKPLTPKPDSTNEFTN